MSEHPYFLLDCPNHNGKLYLTPCPGTAGADIQTALSQLKKAGAVAVVTLMTEEEMHRNKVGALKAHCEALQLEWLHLPIEDEGAPGPSVEKAWGQFATKIHQYLDSNKAVVIHCKGGSGRTGIVAARLLMERGLPQVDAVRQIKALRPNAFMHQVQIDYMQNLPSGV